jgi:hypothetical protein
MSNGLVCICNEEGKLQGLKGNGLLRNDNGVIRDILCGELVVVRENQEEFTSVVPEEDFPVAQLLLRGLVSSAAPL